MFKKKEQRCKSWGYFAAATGAPSFAVVPINMRSIQLPSSMFLRHLYCGESFKRSPDVVSILRRGKGDSADIIPIHHQLAVQAQGHIPQHVLGTDEVIDVEADWQLGLAKLTLFELLRRDDK
jgi:hypothetical protein